MPTASGSAVPRRRAQDPRDVPSQGRGPCATSSSTQCVPQEGQVAAAGADELRGNRQGTGASHEAFCSLPTDSLIWTWQFKCC